MSGRQYRNALQLRIMRTLRPITDKGFTAGRIAVAAILLRIIPRSTIAQAADHCECTELRRLSLMQRYQIVCTTVTRNVHSWLGPKGQVSLNVSPRVSSMRDRYLHAVHRVSSRGRTRLPHWLCSWRERSDFHRSSSPSRIQRRPDFHPFVEQDSAWYPNACLAV